MLHSAGTEGADPAAECSAQPQPEQDGGLQLWLYIFHVPVIGAAKLLIVPRVSSAIQATLWFPLVLMAVRLGW
ncbi:MAG: hypothetical protein WA532_08635 [Candidatus Korobacteraceae bacterium]